MSAIVAERFGTADDLLYALSRRNARWEGRPMWWLFRGQAEAHWNLDPSAMRDTPFSYGMKEPFRLQTSHRDQVMSEARLIRSFLLLLDRQGLPVPGEAAGRWRDFMVMMHRLIGPKRLGIWPPPDLAPVFALAQHHGIPTRLLDWSEKPLVAAFFAARDAAERLEAGKQEGDFLAVWALSQRARALLHRTGFDLKYVRPLRSQNPNLHAQEGVFTLLIDEQRDGNASARFPAMNSLFAERSRIIEAQEAEIKVPSLIKLECPVAEAGRLLRVLHEEWVEATYLFPGVAGVVQAMCDRRLWDEQRPYQ